MHTNGDSFVKGPKIIFKSKDETPEQYVERADLLDSILLENPPLTKREYFAALALSGLCVSPSSMIGVEVKKIADRAVTLADCLIEALNQDVK